MGRVNLPDLFGNFSSNQEILLLGLLYLLYFHFVFGFWDYIDFDCCFFSSFSFCCIVMLRGLAGAVMAVDRGGNAGNQRQSVGE